MRILVTGSKGQLGFDCLRALKRAGYNDVIGIDKEDLDITEEKKVISFISKIKPDVVIHNAAWTQVDKAEENPTLVYKINKLGPKYIAEACKLVDAKMVFISTDYVFDGKGEDFFKIDSPKNGLSVYGKSKSDAEDCIKNIFYKYFIIRTSWVFGINGNNFVKTMLHLADLGKNELNVVCDQIGSPTYTVDLSNFIVSLICTEKYGCYHVTNEGICSWAEFAEFIFNAANKKVKVNYISTEDYNKIVKNQAIRPLNSRLDKTSIVKNGFERLPTWQDAVLRFIKFELER